MFKKSLVLLLLFVSVTLLFSLNAFVFSQGIDDAITDCDVVFDLIEQRTLPDVDELRVADGGQITSTQDVAGTIPLAAYAQIWTIQIAELTANNRNQVSFFIDNNDAALEVELFLGVDEVKPETEPEIGYVDTLGGEDFRFNLLSGGLYTLVIRRKNIADTSVALDYELRDIALPPLSTMPIARDAGDIEYTVNANQELYDDISVVNSSASVYVHRNNDKNAYNFSEQYILFLDNPNSFVVNNWATTISLLGGDLSVYGNASPTGERILYIESFDAGNLQASPTDGGLRIFSIAGELALNFNVNWQIVQGVWILDNCTGVLMRDGRQFVADTTGAQGRVLTFQNSINNNLSSLEFRVNRAVNLNGNFAEGTLTVPHSLILRTDASNATDTTPIMDLVPNINVFLDANGVYQLALPDERALQLQANELDLMLTDGAGNYDVTGTVERVTSVGEHPYSIDIDWSNVDQVRLLGLNDAYAAHFRFTDIGRAGETTTRPAENLARLVVEDNVIRMDYALEEGVSQQRLLLPAEESFIELIMWDGQAPSVTTAFPHQDGFLPNAANNLGGECYPINTLLSEINCAPNGHPNPANGNLWYAVTDLEAQGYLLNLSLTRSYNSYDSEIDGLFGMGWTSDFLLDYDVAYEQRHLARVVDLTQGVDYRVALDLTWMPGGIVTAILPSGSRHVFREISPDANQFRSASMSGWTLTRSARSWVLEQPSGLAYHYDRAGRLTQFGYDFNNGVDRMVSIAYPYDANGALGFSGEQALNGPGGTQGQPIIISDSSERQLELYFNAEHHLERSRLVAVQEGVAVVASNEACQIEAGCFETNYSYDGDFLTRVHYADGQTAYYEYGGNLGELSLHHDPKAPVFPVMQYEYLQSNDPEMPQGIEDIFVLPYDLLRLSNTDQASRERWRRLEYDVRSGDCETLCTVVWDETLSSSEYIYNYGIDVRNQCSERSNGADFTIASISYADESYDARLYRWEGNQLIEICPQEWTNPENQNQTRMILNSMRFNYQADGSELSSAQGVSQRDPLTNGQFAGFAINRDANGLAIDVTLADGSRVSNSINPDGTIASISNAYGASTEYDWNGNENLLSAEPSDSNNFNYHHYVYQYNDFGFITAIEVASPASDLNNPYIIEYEWDSFGRLIAVHDTYSGIHYEITYEYIAEDCLFADIADFDDTGCKTLQMDVTDAIGTTTRYSFDLLNRLSSFAILNEIDEEEVYLRYEAYAYNEVSIRFWHELSTVTTGLGIEQQITRYNFGQASDNTLRFCDGVQGAHTGLEVVSAGGQSISYCYDALERIIRITDELDHVVEYDYEFIGFTDTNVGMRIVERDLYRNRITYYDFDKLHSRLLAVTVIYSNGEQQTWNFSATPTENPYSQLTSSTLDIREQNLSTGFTYSDVYTDNGRILSAAINQNRLSRTIPYTLSDPSIVVGFDPYERLSSVSYDLENGVASDAASVLYCASANGMTRILRFANMQGTGDCNNISETTVEREVWVDHYERVRCIDYGQQIYFVRFNADSTNNIWQVSLEFYGEGIACRDLLLNGATGMPTPQAIWLTSYNTAGDLRTWTDESNMARTYCYDSIGRLSSVRTTESNLDLSCPIEAVLDAALANAVDAVLPDDTPLKFLADSDDIEFNANCPSEVSDELAEIFAASPETMPSVTAFAYDANNQLRWQVNELGQGVEYTYNAFGQVLTERDCPSEETNTYVYGLANQLENIITAQGNIVTITYDENNPDYIASVIDVAGNVHQYEWSISTNTVTYINPQDYVTQYRYDGLGNIWRVVGENDALNDAPYTAQFVYNDLGALTQYITADESDDTRIVAIRYGTNGAGITLGTVEQSSILESQRRALPLDISNMALTNNFTIGINPVGQVDNLTSGRDGARQVSYVYDSVGRLEGLLSNDGIEFYGFDWLDATNQVCVSTIDGQTFTYEYNPNGQITYVWADCPADGEPLVRFVYNSSGLTDDTDVPGMEYIQIYVDANPEPILVYRNIPTTVDATLRNVDPDDQAGVYIDTPGHRLQYDLNSAGLITNIIDISCLSDVINDPAIQLGLSLSDYCIDTLERDGTRLFETQIDYNDYGLPLTIIDSEQGVQTFVYDALGNLDNYQNASRDSFDYVYDELNRLKYINNSNNVRLWLDYNPHGQVTGVCRTRSTSIDTYDACVGDATENLVLEEYDYDELGRLTARSYFAESGDTSQRYTLCYTYSDQGSRSAVLIALSSDSCNSQASPHINIRYGVNGLGDVRLISNLTVNRAGDYEFLYANPTQLTTINTASNSQSISSDIFGRLDSITLNGTEFTLETNGQQGFSIVADGDAELRYNLTPIRLFQSVSFSNESSTAEDFASIVDFVYRVDEDGTPFLYRSVWNNGSEQGLVSDATVTVNDDGTLDVITYGRDLIISNDYDAANRVVRQTLSGDRALAGFQTDDGVHIITTQYENDGRPRSMRLSRNDGASLTISYTYDSYGRLDTETRQYQSIEDVIQYRIDYRYADGTSVPNNHTQLLSREITKSSNQFTQNTVSVITILAAIGLGAWAFFKRRIRVLMLSGLIGVSLLASSIIAQDGDLLIFDYTYDDFGNLVQQDVTSREETCSIEYDYDGLNRLIAVESDTMDTAYAYDAYNRLIAITRDGQTQVFSYLGDQSLPIASQIGDNPIVFYGRTADNTPLFEVDETGDIVQILHQGNLQAPLTTTDPDNKSPNIWLYDPLGRFLNELNAPDLGCEMDAVSDAFISGDAPFESYFPLITWNGMIWDPASNLFFDDGRVYSPSIGRYFQRRAAGPTILGDVYFLDTIAPNPPHQVWEAPHLSGLDTLREAQAYVSVGNALSAESVLAGYSPVLPLHAMDPDIQTLQAINQRSRDALFAQVMMPQWIQTQYARSQVFLADGGIRWSNANAAAQNIHSMQSALTMMPSLWGDSLSVSDILQAPVGDMLAVLNPTQLPSMGISTYVSNEWRPNTAFSITTPTARLEMRYPPSSLLAWFVEPLATVDESAEIMRMGDALDNMILRPSQDWLQDSYAAAMPSFPNIPIYDTDTWLAQWFDADIFGIERSLDAPLQLPELPSVPTYQFGANLPILDGYISEK